jgi:hypothetical protein
MMHSKYIHNPIDHFIDLRAAQFALASAPSVRLTETRGALFDG